VRETMPAAEADVTIDLVRRLLAEQHPDLADLPLEVMANGWDNVMFRLGAGLIVRVPRRQLGVQCLESEQRWLPELAAGLPLPVTAPVRIGRPSGEYPWPWSIVPFQAGQPAAVTPPADPAQAAASIGGFLRALHRPGPLRPPAGDAPDNLVRGVPLDVRAGAVAANMAALGDEVDRDRVQELWDAARAVPYWDGPPLWLHGDLHPANILVHEGRISAVIDFGDLTTGDPATDLSVAWMLFEDPAHREIFWQAYGPAATEQTKQRARGWALALSLVMQAHSADNPLMHSIGTRTYRTVLAAQ
jgi:aminoglycoside phosphotransferase (APT) family kinase protein